MNTNKKLLYYNKYFIFIWAFFLTHIPVFSQVKSSDYVLSVSGTELRLNGELFKILGLRCSNALISDETTDDLINSLDLYKSYGVNTVSVYFMGSRFGDVKGYLPDTTLNPVYTARMTRIIEEADDRGMVVLVGCLYWGTSTAKEELEALWGQEEASAAVKNTVQWLSDNNYRNVFVDPDNEAASPWNVNKMILKGKEADSDILIVNNSKGIQSASDFNVHFGPIEAQKPWVESEGSPTAYWGNYSKKTYEEGRGYYNYSRIGRHTNGMKQEILDMTVDRYENFNGMMLASTWLQCGPSEGINGPFTSLGGQSNFPFREASVDVDVLHTDAGIRWWMDFIKDRYGAWEPPAALSNEVDQAYFEETGGLLVLEAESYHEKYDRIPTNGTQKLEHAWTEGDRFIGFSGTGYMSNLPDEQPERGPEHNSPKNGSGAEMVYYVKINTPGVYKVWARGRSFGGESNGMHIQIDDTFIFNGPGTNMSGFRPHRQWVWEHASKPNSQEANLTFSAGMHKIHIFGRDDGFSLDKIVLGINQNSAPSGEGPDESREFVPVVEPELEFAASNIDGEIAIRGVRYGSNLTQFLVGETSAGTLTFRKLSGPGWLRVEDDGRLRGGPRRGHVGENIFAVSVENLAGERDEASLVISVHERTAEYIDFLNEEGYVDGSLDAHGLWETSKNPEVSQSSGRGRVYLNGGFGRSIYTEGLPKLLEEYSSSIHFQFKEESTAHNFKPLVYTSFNASRVVSDNERITVFLQRAGNEYRLNLSGGGAGVSLNTNSEIRVSAEDIGLDLPNGDDVTDDLLLCAKLYRGDNAAEWAIRAELFNLSEDSQKENPLITMDATDILHQGLYEADHIYGGFGGGQGDANAQVSERRIDAFEFTGSGATVSGFNQFLANHSLTNALSDDDDDNDGVSNFLEYALGGDPQNPSDLGHTLKIDRNVSDQLYISVPELNGGDNDIEYILQMNSDLTSGDWQTLPRLNPRIVTINGEPDFIETKYELRDTATNKKMFFRLMVEER